MKSMSLPKLVTPAAVALAIAVGGVFCLAGPAHAAVPQTVHLEGTLLSNGGGPVADGNYTVTFSLYAAKTAGSAMWQEGPVAIAVKNGQWAYALGTKKPIAAAAISAAKELWFGVKVGNDPELPRSRMHSGFYAQAAATAWGVSCTGCIATSALKPGPLNLKGQTITAKEFIGDGSKLTGIKIPSGTCGAGLLAKGIDSNGKLICAKAAPLPDDGISQVSQGLVHVVGAIYEQTAKVNIPDNNPAGTHSKLVIPNVGNVDKLTFTVEINIKAGNNGIGNLKLCLVAPGGADHKLNDKPFCGGAKRYKLHDSTGGTAKKLIGTWPDPNKILSGDLTKDYFGKNPAGTWKLWVVDTKYDNNSSSIAEITSFSASARTTGNKKIAVQGQQVVTGNASFKKDVHIAGNLTIGGSSSPFPDSIAAQVVFPAGSRPMLLGIKHDWMDNAYNILPHYNYASDMPKDNNSLHQAVDRIVWGDKDGNFKWQIGGDNRGNDNGNRSALYLTTFIKNTSASNQKHQVCWYMTGYPWDGSYGSLAINGSNVYSRADGFSGGYCRDVTFPAKKSSIISVKAGQVYWTSDSGAWGRVQIGFYNNCWRGSTMKSKSLEWDYLRFYKWMKSEN